MKDKLKLIMDISLIVVIVGMIALWILYFPFNLWPLGIIAVLFLFLYRRGKKRRKIESEAIKNTPFFP